MAVTRGRWAARLLFAVATVVVVVVGVRLSNDDIALLPLCAGVLAGCAVWWFATDAGGAASTVRWTEPEEYPAHYTRGDPAASYLRRLCEEGTTRGRRTSPVRPVPCRTPYAARAGPRRPAPAAGASPLQTLPAPLERYLQTDPAPRLHPEDLDRIVTSIEEL